MKTNMDEEYEQSDEEQEQSDEEQEQSDEEMEQSGQEQEQSEDEQDMCAICQDDLFLSCGIDICDHRFCFECMMKWTKNRRRSGVSPTCPTCRQEFQQIFVYVLSESVLNTIERIVYGQNRRHTPVNQYYLRRLIHSPHWNHLDRFWFRMHLIGLVDYNRIRFLVLIDGRDDISSEWFLNRNMKVTFDNPDTLLKTVPSQPQDTDEDSDEDGEIKNECFVMALILCNRHENV